MGISKLMLMATMRHARNGCEDPATSSPLPPLAPLPPPQERWKTMLDVEAANIPADIFDRVFPAAPVPNPAVLNDNTLEDMQLADWCRSQCHTQGGCDLFYKMVSRPTTNINLLMYRQDMIQRAHPEWQSLMKELAGLEKGTLWLFTLPERMEDVWPLPLLYPSLPVLRKINRHPTCLTAFHAYRIWITPILQIVIPVMSILGPWLYMRYRMGWKLTLGQYFQLAKFMFMQSLAGATTYEKASRISMLFMYAFMFIYGIIQTIEISKMLHAVKKQMVERVQNIQRFVREAHHLVSQWFPGPVPPCPIIPSGMAGMHALWLDKPLRDSIASLVSRLYELDVSLACRRLMDEGWTPVKYRLSKPNKTHQMCYGMKNPVLTGKQTTNPMCLSSNILVTGPNAAGKSTYVRSIGANIILSQTLGICCAQRMEASPVSAILSYMRVQDLLGTGSLFETEVAHCAGILRTAAAVQEHGGSAVIFFDEPMHSTPPMEGEAAAYAVLQHLGNMPNIRTIVTSHYHRLTELPASRWRNVSMDAKKTPAGTYVFPYRIQPGPSFQSIALELLHGTDKLPASVVQNAIKFKSSISKSKKTKKDEP